MMVQVGQEETLRGADSQSRACRRLRGDGVVVAGAVDERDSRRSKRSRGHEIKSGIRRVSEAGNRPLGQRCASRQMDASGTCTVAIRLAPSKA